MRMLVTLVHEGGAPQDVVVTADATATAVDVAEVLGTAVGRAAPPPGRTPGNVVPEIIGLEAPDGERSALLHEALLDELLPTWRDDVAAVG